MLSIGREKATGRAGLEENIRNSGVGYVKLMLGSRLMVILFIMLYNLHICNKYYIRKIIT